MNLAVKFLAGFVFLFPISFTSSVYAQGAKATSAVELARKADALKPGEWVWAPRIAPSGPISVYVDLSRQIATVYRNGVRIGVSTVSSGKKGHETPTGVFTILQKDAKHRSSTYNNAPMPFQQRLTWDGVALHAGGLPGYPESHGCVHLPLEFSRQLFQASHLGMTVVVAGKAGGPPIHQMGGVLAPFGDKVTVDSHLVLRPDETYRWTPDLSSSGPVTIVVSRSDQRILVLRNGVEIGRSRISLPDVDTDTHVLTYARNLQGKLSWILVGVPGHAGEQGDEVNANVLAQVKMPVTFRTSMQSVIEPGTTILVTQAPVLPTTTGGSLTVLTSAE